MNRLLPILSLLVLCGWFCPSMSIAEDKKSESFQEAAKKVKEITLERSGAGKGPENSLTLRSDGTAIYIGKKNVERIGRYKGSIPEHGFHDNFPLLAETYA